jgi:four helix bundle protein
MVNETGSKIEKFEDLIAWQKARVLTANIYRVSRNEEFGRDFRLSSQIQGAAVSIMSNVAEGFERGGLGEFHQFLSTAKASCAELRSQLYVALDVGYIDSPTFHDLRTQAEEVGRIVGGLRVSIARQRIKRSSRRG